MPIIHRNLAGAVTGALLAALTVAAVAQPAGATPRSGYPSHSRPSATASARVNRCGLGCVGGHRQNPRAVADGAPGAPVNVTVTPAAAQLTVSWAAPADTGAAPITGYTATAVSAGWPVRTCGTSATTCIIDGLVNGASYTVYVTASNSAGMGDGSTPVTVTVPVAAPGAPQSVYAVARDGWADVSWSAPTDAVTTNYLVTLTSPGHPTVTCDLSSATSCRVAPLMHNTTYSVAVVARNSAGSGPASAPATVTIPSGNPYQLTSSTYIINPLRGEGPHTGSCAPSYHVDGDWFGPGASWQPHLIINGKWIKLGATKPADQNGTDPAGKPTYQSVTVNLYNQSAISQHTGSFTWTCDPN